MNERTTFQIHTTEGIIVAEEPSLEYIKDAEERAVRTVRELLDSGYFGRDGIDRAIARDVARDIYCKDIAPLSARLAASEARVEEVELERDLAIAHDTQPYPTADAYEKVCAALEKANDRIARLERCVEKADELRAAIGPLSSGPSGKLRMEYDAARAAEREGDVGTPVAR